MTATLSPSRPRAYGLTRVSTGKQALSGLGLEAQQDAISSCASRMGADLIDTQDEPDVSGATPNEDRPVLMDTISRLGRGDVLIVAKRDRLGRDPIHVAMIERLVERRGARIVSAAGEGTADDEPTSVLMRRIVDAFAEYERLCGKSRTRMALRAKRQRGERAGNVPFGYLADQDGRLTPNLVEQGVIAAVVSAQLAGMTQREIVSALAVAGVVGRKGKPLTKTQVQRILRARRG